MTVRSLLQMKVRPPTSARSFIRSVIAHLDGARRASSLEMPSKGWIFFVSQIGTVVVTWYVFNRLLCDRFDLMDAYDPSSTALGNRTLTGLETGT